MNEENVPHTNNGFPFSFKENDIVICYNVSESREHQAQ